MELVSDVDGGVGTRAGWWEFTAGAPLEVPDGVAAQLLAEFPDRFTAPGRSVPDAGTLVTRRDNDRPEPEPAPVAEPSPVVAAPVVTVPDGGKPAETPDNAPAPDPSPAPAPTAAAPVAPEQPAALPDSGTPAVQPDNANGA